MITRCPFVFSFNKSTTVQNLLRVYSVVLSIDRYCHSICHIQGWGEIKNELELFSSIPEFELKDFEQVEFELKDFE